MASKVVIEAEDLSEINLKGLTLRNTEKAIAALYQMLQDQWQWLDHVSMNGRIDRNEPVISFDQYSGKIRAGRFIGSIEIANNCVLRVSPKEPDFFEGMLEEIYGVKFIKSPNDTGREGFYNWHLIRTIFYGRLLRAYGKSLPLVRRADVVAGQYLSGKLNVASVPKMR